MSDDEKPYGVWTTPAGLRLVAPSCAKEVEATDRAEKEYARDNPMSYYVREPQEVNDNAPPSPISDSTSPWHQQLNPMEFFKSGEQLEIDDYIAWATKDRDTDIDVE